jgi:hypothetical protein
MSFEEKLDDELPQDSWADAIQDLQARQIALVSLLTARGVFTEAEFNQDRHHWARLLDEERTRRIDERAKLAEQLQAEADANQYAVWKACFGQVDMLRNPEGLLVVRIVAEEFEGCPRERRVSLSRSVLQPRHEQNYTLIALTPAEKPTSVASLSFDVLIDAMGLTKLEE